MSIVQVQTHVRCDGCGAQAPPAAGIVRARVLARELGWKADGSRQPDKCANCLALEEYNQLVRRIGQGFHPDTPYEDYEPPLNEKMSKEYFDRTIDRVFLIDGCDPYAIGLDIWHEMENERLNLT